MNSQDQRMYALRIFDEDGSLLDYTSGPGEVGDWMLLSDDSPVEAALFFGYQQPIPAAWHEQYNSLKASRTALDENFEEIAGSEEEGILLCELNLEQAREKARELEVEFCYFFSYDGSRNIYIVVAEDDRLEVYSYDDN